MRLTDTTTGDTLIHIDEYADLLAVRSISEWTWESSEPPIVRAKTAALAVAGLAPSVAEEQWPEPSRFLFDYQLWIVKMALDRERFAIFADCGLGKTAMQLEWARSIIDAARARRLLIVAPLQVVAQTIEESSHWYGPRLPIRDLTSRDDLTAWLANGSGVGITNYEKLDGINERIDVDAVVLDESSVLKQSMGTRRTSMMKAFAGVRYKLCCTATPAPNDRVEYAEHAFFLDVVRSPREFLAAYFVNRDGEWQLKHHGEDAFYRHLAAWSVFMRSPAAYGFENNLADLKPLEIIYPHIGLTPEQMEAAREYEAGTQPSLFGATPGGIVSRTKVMQIAHGFKIDGKTIDTYPTLKPAAIAAICNVDHPNEQIVIWVTFDREAEQLAELIEDAAVIDGRTPKDKRPALIDAFRSGTGARVLIVKPGMFGFGLNLQNCRVQIFSTITDSFERFYQAVRRSHRYGQTEAVRVYIPLTQLDDAICNNVMSKETVWKEDGTRQEQAYIGVLRPNDETEKRVWVTTPQTELDRVEHELFTAIHGDSIAHMAAMEPESMDLAVFSPPFANLFTYSSALADMGNVRSDTEYRLQWKWFAEGLVRIMKPGRTVAVHCQDVIRFAGQHGHRHTYDYPSDLRAGMEDAGFYYRARIAIDKNPQLQATRTKDSNLLFVTLKRNALDSHPQAAEYVLIFTTPGTPDVPVIADDISNKEWIAWAHHIWYDIRETDVLNAALGKEHDDERHICPLQLGLIERVIRLWTNRGETVFSPFMGIGSEGHEAVRLGRKFYGCELKRSYFDTAVRFMTQQADLLEQQLDFGA